MRWRTDWENAPKEAHVWAWGRSLHWRNGGVAYVHENYNGHKDVITKNGRAGQPFRIADEDAPTHFMEMVLPDAPFQQEGTQ